MAEAQIYYALPTRLCRHKFASAQADGTSIQLTAMAVGAASYTPSDSQLDLLDEKYRGQLLSAEPDPDNPTHLIVTMLVPATVGGFVINEAGIFDADGDLAYIAKTPTVPKPTFAEGAGLELLMQLDIEMTAQASVELVVNPYVVGASKQYVDDAIDASQFGPVPWRGGLYCAPPDAVPKGVSLVFGDDGKLYQATAISGPGTDAGPQDPVTSTGFWQALVVTASEVEDIAKSVSRAGVAAANSEAWTANAAIYKKIVFTNIYKDSFNEMSAAGTFTASKSGGVIVSATGQPLVQGSGTSGFFLYKNGTVVGGTTSAGSAVGQAPIAIHNVFYVDVVEGDTLEIYLYTNFSAMWASNFRGLFTWL